MYIEINHSKLGKSAETIDDYLSFMIKYMDLSTNKVNNLVARDWLYEDANTFKNQWSKNNDATSVTNRMKASLRSYSNALKYAEEQYKKAQSKAVNKANSL